MKVYEGANIRNVAVVGHGKAGKTSLVSAMLQTAGATQRLGRVDDGTATTDYDDEEIARKMSISSALAYVEWDKSKINIIDTPGFSMFVHEAKMALPAVDAAIVVVDGVAGVEVVTQRVWNYCEEFKTPRLIVASRMDRERADANRVLESLTTAFGRTVIPLELPIGSEKNFSGVVDLVNMKAYTYELGGSGKGKEGEIPANLKEQAQAAHEKLVEMVAEGNDALMEEFFEKGTIPEEHLVPALHEAIREDKIFPVIFGSGLGNIGADRVMDFIVAYTPAPSEHEWVQGEPAASGNGDAPRRHETDTEPVSIYVFKTVNDAFAGRISYFKVFSGVLKNDAALQNFSRGTAEKLAHISIMQGKTTAPVNELHAGDIGAVAKLKDTLTGDTLGDKSAPIQYPKVPSAGTGHYFCHRAQEPRRRGQARPQHSQADGRRRHAALLPRSSNPRIPHRRHRPAAYRSGGGKDEEALPRRSEFESAQSAVSRDYSWQSRRSGTPQEADGRPRAVRRLQNQDGAVATRRRVRIR